MHGIAGNLIELLKLIFRLFFWRETETSDDRLGFDRILQRQVVNDAFLADSGYLVSFSSRNISSFDTLNSIF